MNYLVTAVGSMSAKSVINSLLQDGNNFVVGTDTNSKHLLPNANLLDEFIKVPSVSDSYFTLLKQIIREYNIDFVLPLTDIEIDFLSIRRKWFQKHNVRLCISDKNAVSICRNKKNVYEFFKEGNDNFLTIPTYEFDELSETDIQFPLITKPRLGRSSEGLFKIRDSEQLKLFKNKLDNIFQPIIEGYVYTVDYVRDSIGNDFAVSRKELIRTSNGAGTTIKVINNPILNKSASYIGRKIGVLGCINIEFISSGADFYLLDINPRFSAGVEFSKLAGYDFISEHVKAFSNNNITSNADITPMVIAKDYKEIVMQVE